MTTKLHTIYTHQSPQQLQPGIKNLIKPQFHVYKNTKERILINATPNNPVYASMHVCHVPLFNYHYHC